MRLAVAIVLLIGACDEDGGHRRREVVPGVPEPTEAEREQWRRQQEIEKEVERVRTLQQATQAREAARLELEAITAEEAELEKALEQATSADEVAAIKRRQAELYRRKSDANVRFYGSGAGSPAGAGSGTGIGTGVLL